MQYTKTVFLKNNKECLLRNAVGTDAEEIHKIFNLTHAQTDFLCTYPDENLFDTEEERYFLLELLVLKLSGKKIRSNIVRSLESVLKKDSGALESVML